MRTSIIGIKGIRTEIEEPETNKMCEELTRLIAIARYWDNKSAAMLLQICLKARDRRKMIYGHPKNVSEKEKKFNTFYSDNYESRNNGYSIFITSVSVLINDEEVSQADAYIRLLRSGMCHYKRNNPFGVIRKGNMFEGYSYLKE